MAAQVCLATLAAIFEDFSSIATPLIVVRLLLHNVFHFEVFGCFCFREW